MTYSPDFFAKRHALAKVSASLILESFCQVFRPTSVLDLGCATGIWLAEAKRKGVGKVLGIDGPWVPMELLEIGESEFMMHDLGESDPQEISRFDAAFCIEVAEHLAPESGDRVVAFMAAHTDVVLFSAAIPGQGGTGHINEQPQSYWFEKFDINGFDCFDLIRPGLWDDSEVNVIYKQNMVVYVRRKTEMYDRLLASKPVERPIVTGFDLNRVHPELFVLRANALPRCSFGSMVKRLWNALRRR